MRAQSSGCSHFGFRPPEGGTPWVRQVGSSGFSRWGADTSRCVGLFDPKTAVQPKETKEAKEFEGVTQTRPPTYRVNGIYFRTSFLSAFCVSFGHPTAGLRWMSCPKSCFYFPNRVGLTGPTERWQYPQMARQEFTKRNLPKEAIRRADSKPGPSGPGGWID